jgi:putative inorganic carbon (HCO3(-)) transporter
MSPLPSLMSRAATWLTFAAAASIVLSIFAFNVLMALALAALLLSGKRLRLPPIKLPLGIFLSLTVVAWIYSPDPWVDGFPQIKKFWVFCILLLVFSTLRGLSVLRWLLLAWASLASVAALRGFAQFFEKVEQAHRARIDLYQYYVSERITGFTSHWNTYAAEEMVALLVLAAMLLFGPLMRKSWIWILCGALMAVALYLGWTRAVWMATGTGGLYLMWSWKRWTVFSIPVIAGVAFVASPTVMRERITSTLHGRQVDSNAFRIIAWNAGVQMIEKHPLLGIGPEGPKYHFKEYVPADTWATRPAGFYEHLHNIYLQYGAERGVFALLVFLWLMIRILVDFVRGLRALPPGRGDRRYLLHAGIAVVIAVLVEGVAEVNLGDSEVLTMFLVVIAAGYLSLENDLAASP